MALFNISVPSQASRKAQRLLHESLRTFPRKRAMTSSSVFPHVMRNPYNVNYTQPRMDPGSEAGKTRWQPRMDPGSEAGKTRWQPRMDPGLEAGKTRWQPRMDPGSEAGKTSGDQQPGWGPMKVKGLWLTSLVVLLISFTAPLHAQHSAVYSYATVHSQEFAALVKTEPLADALLQLAEDRQLELAYAPELLKGKSSDCPLPPQENAAAIECVLKGSGLHARQLGNGVFVIQKPSAKSAPAKGSIIGTVRSHKTGTGLAYAHVILNGTVHSTASSPDGSFEIPHVPPGIYDVQVSMVGYETVTWPNVRVQAGQPNEVELNLKEATLPLDEVLIESKKKRRALSLPDSLDPLAFQGFHLGGVRAGLFMSASPSKVNGVQLSGLGSLARDSLRGVQFGGVFSSAKTADGVQFGGVFNTVYGDLNGYQFSGVMNQLGGTMDGGQFAGTFNQAKDIRGVQISGVANFADGHIRGVQATGIVNVSGNIRGTQLSGIANRAFEVRGFQGTGVMNYAVTSRGMQASGVMNVNAGDSRGVQASGVINYNGGTQRGAQISGILNVAGHKRGGIQIGLVNLSKTNSGLPLGLFSFVQETGLRVDTWMDERGVLTSAIRTGNRWFSNYIGISAPVDGFSENESILLGLGGEFTHGNRFYSTLDAMYQTYDIDSSDFNEQVVQIRALGGFKVFRHIAIFGGPSLNLLLSDNPESTVPIPDRLLDNGTWGSTDYSLWAGFAFGIRVSTNGL